MTRCFWSELYAAVWVIGAWLAMLVVLVFGLAMFAWLLLVAMIWMSGVVISQEHSHDGAAGKFYETWMMPDAPYSSCCNKKDCYATEARFVNGVWFALIRETGKFVPVPDAKIEHNRDSPDGRNHVCANSEGRVFCFKAGGGT